jgi:hypothetical protein
VRNDSRRHSYRHSTLGLSLTSWAVRVVKNTETVVMFSNRYFGTGEKESVRQGRKETAQELVATGAASLGFERSGVCRRREIDCKSNDKTELFWK